MTTFKFIGTEQDLINNGFERSKPKDTFWLWIRKQNPANVFVGWADIDNPTLVVRSTSKETYQDLIEKELVEEMK